MEVEIWSVITPCHYKDSIKFIVIFLIGNKDIFKKRNKNGIADFGYSFHFRAWVEKSLEYDNTSPFGNF